MLHLPSGDSRSADAGIGSALRWWGVPDKAHDKLPDMQFNGGYALEKIFLLASGSLDFFMTLC
jgi:hypothetical protein